MADFFQTGALATLHRLGPTQLEWLETRLVEFTREAPLVLVLPCHARDLENPALPRIITELSRVPYLSRIVLGLDEASVEQWQTARRIFGTLPQPVTILWNDGPRLAALRRELVENALDPGPSGKGRNLWLSFGEVIAAGDCAHLVVHDCDILTYSREFLARLCYPVAHPNLGFDFGKGYSARFTDRLNGRVMRLMFTPLIRALESIIGQQHFLTYLDTFRYPLAGEVCLSVEIARRIRVPGDWGIEVGLLAEVFRLVAPKSICQVELMDCYDHKHQDLSAEDPDRGLHKMAVEIARSIFQTLASQGVKMDQGLFDTLLTAFQRKADDMLRFSAADAEINGLAYDRHHESLAVATFARGIRLAASKYLADPLGDSPIPSWDRVESALPGFLKKFHDAIRSDQADSSFPSHEAIDHSIKPISRR